LGVKDHPWFRLRVLPLVHKRGDIREMINNFQLSDHFWLYEFECKDGSHQVVVDDKLIELLQKLRDRIGKPLIINSGYRNPEHNKRVGGSSNSQHLYGKAVDVSTNNLDITPTELAQLAKEIGFDGIGIYRNRVHMDVRGYPAFWIDE